MDKWQWQVMIWLSTTSYFNLIASCLNTMDFLDEPSKWQDQRRFKWLLIAISNQKHKTNPKQKRKKQTPKNTPVQLCLPEVVCSSRRLLICMRQKITMLKVFIFLSIMATWTSSRLATLPSPSSPHPSLIRLKTAENNSSQRPTYTLKMTMKTKLKHRSTTLSMIFSQMAYYVTCSNFFSDTFHK